jgi:hypothetical protein
MAAFSLTLPWTFKDSVAEFKVSDHSVFSTSDPGTSCGNFLVKTGEEGSAYAEETPYAAGDWTVL